MFQRVSSLRDVWLRHMSSANRAFAAGAHGRSAMSRLLHYGPEWKAFLAEKRPEPSAFQNYGEGPIGFRRLHYLCWVGYI
jgi:hypothetical protein